jgi:hypothetical protein
LEISVTSLNNKVMAVVPFKKSEVFLFLLAFTHAGWSTCFLTTFNHHLAHTLDPWNIGDGVDILVVFQDILVKAFPGTTYKVWHGDKIYTMVRKSVRILKQYLTFLQAKDHLNDRRALFGH